MAPKESQPWTVPGLSLDLVFIRPGTFTMGSDNGSDNEKPLTVVTLTRGFWLGSTEATQGLWEVLMGGNQTKFRDLGQNGPVENVSWTGAMLFCERLTDRERSAGRLQSEVPGLTRLWLTGRT
jgi:formylglycine-generating enzyme required for sulfatase activity